MSSYMIRVFKKRDADEVVALAGAYAAFDRAMPKDWLLATVKEHPNSVWVAEVDEKVVGFVIGYPTKTRVGAFWGDVELVAVHPKHRRRGIGTKLVEKILGEFKKAHVEEAYLYCPTRAKAARKLYEKLGFTVGHIT